MSPLTSGCFQSVIALSEDEAWEEFFPVAISGEGAWFAYQRMDDVTVVDSVNSSPL
jgi:hypothetical protein